MIFSQTAEYALRAMAWMATLENGTAIRATDLSKAAAVPKHYLSKVMRRLVVAELVISGKGHGGGFALARSQSRIKLLDILAAVDAAPGSGVCAFGWGPCDPNNPCPLHPAWSIISDGIYDWANQTTLADMGPAPENLLTTTDSVRLFNARQRTTPAQCAASKVVLTRSAVAAKLSSWVDIRRSCTAIGLDQGSRIKDQGVLGNALELRSARWWHCHLTSTDGPTPA